MLAARAHVTLAPLHQSFVSRRLTVAAGQMLDELETTCETIPSTDPHALDDTTAD